MKMYCTQCFAKTEYKFSKPKFCPECGAQVGTASSSINIVEKTNKNLINDDNLEKIKRLEKELQELKVSKRVDAKFNYNEYDSESDYENDEEEDFALTQKHINNFKKSVKAGGVVVEKDNINSGISFGQLIQSAANGNSPRSSEDFKMTEGSTGRNYNKQEILEQLKAESSSQARIIEID